MIMNELTDSFPLLEYPPQHVGIIMDGNGRWAEANGKSRYQGHQAGTDNLERLLDDSIEFGVKMITAYAFSTENWRRSTIEIKGLMKILERVIDNRLVELSRKGVQLRHLGDLEKLESTLRKKILQGIESTRHNEKLILNVAFNYGGRSEIVQAVQRVIQDKIPPEQITEELLSRYMYTAGSPDPDLIIRTSGEFRTSNFLIWQAAYAEYYVTPTYWPDFNKTEYYRALSEFGKRDRRYGGRKG